MTREPKSVSVKCLTTGVARQKAGERGVRRYIVEAWREETVPVNVFLVDHPLGLCLFDCGQTAQAMARGYLPQWHPFLRLSRFELSPEDEAHVQLRHLGIDPAAVRWLVLSHLHTDHVGGINAFQKADILVTAAEWRRATGLRGRIRGYVPQHWPNALRPHLVEFTGPPIGPFSGSFDLAGDGRLVLVPTPGHTKGHMSMVVRAGSGGYLICGDLAHSAPELAAVRPEIAAFCRQERLAPLATHDANAAELLH